MPKVLRFDDDPHRDDSHHDARQAEQRPPAEGDAVVRVIVKVNTGGYVPAGFRVRTRVDEEMFTAEATEADLTVAADDPRVESVARAHRLDLP
ncbi:hypothetical protein GCM10023081_26980 [Arthrobacter ginkgonis]|uniref:Uncharacterized protein n=1 Tax=Arthrobacter ginkgonis TaxID=1630594 RepID=A0ABP7CGR1_9MICC